jgi:osmotically-inducible protein OsmY
MLAALLLAGATALSSACAPVVFGGAVVGGALVASDRRPVGIQLEDQAIESRVNRALADHFGRQPANINVTSYNRKVLLAGQVADEAARAQAEQIAARAENVRTVLNELTVSAPSSVWVRNNDTAITARVRTALLQAADVPAGTIVATTEWGTVYLLGRVTEAEGDAAARATSRVSGVHRVVKAFEYLSADELAALRGASRPAESARK